MESETTEKQRFKRAIDLLKKDGKIRFIKDLEPILGVPYERIKSLNKANGPKLHSREIISLKTSFSYINWDWVVTGEGEMTGHDIPEDLNKNKEAVFREVMARTSTLPIEQREQLLIEKVLSLTDDVIGYQQKLAKIAEINNASIFNELKGLFERNKGK